MIYKKKRKGIFKLNCFKMSNDKILSIQKYLYFNLQNIYRKIFEKFLKNYF